MHLVYMITDLLSSCVVSVPAVYAAVRIWDRTPSGKKLLLAGLLTVYLSEVYLIVGLPGIMYIHWDPAVNLLPFRDLGDTRYFFQTGMNALMFVPLGILLPLLWPHYRHLPQLAAAGVLTSGMIELLQLFCFRATDIDDLLMNTLGAVIGFLLVLWWSRRQSEVGGKDAAEFWCINLLIVATTIFIRPLVADLIYSLPCFS